MGRITTTCPRLIVALESISLSFISSKLVSVAFDLSLNFGGGNRYWKDPNDPKSLPKYEISGEYNYSTLFNSGQPFRGGVDYGDARGAPGHYPNLNNEQVRNWWGDQYKYLLDMGLEFIWQDMTSPCMAEGFGDMKS